MGEWLQEGADRVTIAFMPGGAGYFAAAAQAREELVRLRLIEAECDPHTFRYLDAIGVGAGWRCL